MKKSENSLKEVVNGELFVTMTSTGAEFYNGTKSADLVYNGENVHFGLVFCYADVTKGSISAS